MVSSHGIVTKALGKMVGDALGLPAGINKDQGGAVLANKLRHSFVDFVPHLVRGNRPQFAPRHFHSEIDPPLVPNLYDHRFRAAASGKEAPNYLDGFLSRGKTDAQWRTSGERFESLQRKGQVRAPLIVGYSVDFVDDHSVHGGQDFAALTGRQQDVQRLRSGNKNVRWT